ncbi:spermatogenesis-associated protein 1 isoform X2 [Conger conger]|uniref:spermatogenesis-associated protein 1 isoform X2 n=1 Tax=Conger conger TaxID=82655 RepID=UPI002A5A17FA|nr:spermatogenesis-associated protein 1 isoform X2 [Conger conger]
MKIRNIAIPHSSVKHGGGGVMAWAFVFIDELLELHVFYVPEEKWNSKLNKAPVEAIDTFISGGFIRVYPNISLETLRDELGGLLGAEKTIDNFSFLKCVGRSLALVKAKQERELKVKSFVPPCAPHPELYLLPMVEHSDSFLSHSLTPDRQSYHTDLHMYSAKSFCVPTATKKSSKSPQIKRQSPKTQIMQSLGCFSSSDEKEEDLLHSQEPEWDEAHSHLGREREQSPSILAQEEIAPASELKDKSKTFVTMGPRFRRNRTRDSGVPESLEDCDSGFTLSKARNSKGSQPFKYIGKKSNYQVRRNLPHLPTPAQSSPPTVLPHHAIATCKTTATVVLTDNELIEQLKVVREERKQLERTRQGLLRKGKDLLVQNRYRRNQARDSWKRKYFDTKKATEPLESTLKSLRQDLEAFYHKLLHQLQARDGRRKTKRLGKRYAKNELIIQIISESHELDKLKKKVDDAKMKLVTELKLRKQAATELQVLKAELIQKVQSSFPVPHKKLGSQSRSKS